MAKSTYTKSNIKYRNYLMNGDMNISQRGTSFASIPDGAYNIDRYRYGKIGAMVHTITQDSDVPTQAQSGYLFQNSMRLNLVTPDTSIATSDVTHQEQFIEGFNYASFAQRTFSLSFWVKATLPGTYCVAFSNSGRDRSYVAEYTINASATWEYKTVTVTAPPAAGTWNYANGVGLRVTFTLAAGGTFQTAANAWATGDFRATANQVNGVNTGATDFRITGLMLNEGPEPLNFRLFDESATNDIAACQRYTYVPDAELLNTTGDMGVGQCVAATQAIIDVKFPVKMRTSPSLTVANPTSFGVTANTGTIVAATTIGSITPGADMSRIVVNVAAGLTAGNGTFLLRNSSVTGQLLFSAEL